MRPLSFVFAAAATMLGLPAQAATPIEAAVADPTRSAENRARDRYRHPVETLSFFGIRPEQTVVEFSPGGGWYTEILAPIVNGKGRYVALTSASPKAVDATTKMIAVKGARLGKVGTGTVDYATGKTTVAPGSADVVLTFRNVHNLGTNAANVFRAFHTALKPGGVLGVVDHRLPESRDSALEKASGYIKRSTVVRLATEAGFRLAGESQVNANPKDTADYPDGVWTLPPTLRKGEQDRARYLAIGESDRMTLRFVKAK